MLLADSPGDELGILGAEVEDNHPLGIDGVDGGSCFGAAGWLG
jgi:hypothetical protein